MFYELISVIAAGFAAAGLALLARRLLPRLPRWSVPIAAGAAMLAVAIANEYGWYDRQKNALPEGLEIVATQVSQSPLRPWTLIRPFTNGFTALDHLSQLSNPDLPDMTIINLYHYSRWHPVRRSTIVFDCITHRQATLPAGAQIASDGDLTGASWTTPGAAYLVACAGI